MVVRDAKRAAILFFARGGVGLFGPVGHVGLVGPFGPVGCGITKKRRLRYRNLLLVGEMWVSNPRPSEPQSDALTS